MSAPLGVFLLVGASGLGKRSLAAKTGEHLFGRDGVMRIDLGECEDPLAAIEAAGVGGRAVILENADLANPRLLDFLVRLVGGQTECGDSGGMRFGEQVLFLLVHKDVAGLDEVPAEGGDGPFEEALTRDLGIDKRLHWSSHAVLPFRLPQREECAEVVLQHMSQVIAEEVRAVTESGSFEILPSRVFKRMQRAIHSAIGSGAGVVQVE